MRACPSFPKTPHPRQPALANPLNPPFLPDYICNWLGNAAVAANTRAPGYHASGYANISTPDNIVHGQVKQSGNFAFARIFEAGHAVPF